jgi:sugar phosphate isomerase/epimerase
MNDSGNDFEGYISLQTEDHPMFKYAICNETFEGWEWEATCQRVAECGYHYIEVAPFTLAEDIRTLDADARQRLRKTADSCGLTVVGLHWLLVSPTGLSITSDDAAVRQSTSDYLTALVDFCADLGGTTMVLGSPAQRRLPALASCAGRLPVDVAVERLTFVLSPALQRCQKRAVTLCLEPLPAPEADFVLTLQEAVNIIARVDHPCFRTMLDIKSASSELLSIPELIRKYHPLIEHVHANDTNRRGPGFGEVDFVPILQTLNAVGYDGLISIEVFDYTPDPVTIAQQSLDYLKLCQEQDTLA